ncbi:hypothetical protein AHiyo4_34930 [Arthrobacter sp. Hiyo4]|nr:hypothetical protein AHiyo4_34930 [Arthrobacter sp. Hiyo4]
MALEALEQAVSARFLSLSEREKIADLRSQGTSMQAIGRALSRSVGTISREIKRNSHPVLGYQPYGATAPPRRHGHGPRTVSWQQPVACATTWRTSCASAGPRNRSRSC